MQQAVLAVRAGPMGSARLAVVVRMAKARAGNHACSCPCFPESPSVPIRGLNSGLALFCFVKKFRKKEKGDFDWVHSNPRL